MVKTTLIIILKRPLDVYGWKNRTAVRLYNPDIRGLEIFEHHVSVRETDKVEWKLIPKTNIESMTLIFDREEQ